MERTMKKTIWFSCVCVLFLSCMFVMPQISMAAETSAANDSLSASTKVTIWSDATSSEVTSPSATGDGANNGGASQVLSSLPKTGDSLIYLIASLPAVALTSGVLTVLSKRGENNG